jgi:hypothetical protein
MSGQSGFSKKCGVCGKEWHLRENFLSDRNVKLIGYQPNFESLTDGMFLFNHTVSECGTTLSLPVRLFEDLYDGPRGSEIMNGTDRCRGHCMKVDDLEECDTDCKYAYPRKIMIILKKRMLNREY